MKPILIVCIFTLALAGLGIPEAVAQTNTTGATPSLGELARKLRAERKEEGKKPVAVFTNDNLPSKAPLGVAPAVTAAALAPENTEAGETTSAGGNHGQAYFSKRASTIRDRMSMHQRELAVLEQKLSQSQMVYYPNPQKTLEQESSPQFQSDVTQLKKDIEDKKQQIADDQKAMDDLQQELRRDGGDPGWIR